MRSTRNSWFSMLMIDWEAWRAENPRRMRVFTWEWTPEQEARGRVVRKGPGNKAWTLTKICQADGATWPELYFVITGDEAFLGEDQEACAPECCRRLLELYPGALGQTA